MGFSIERNGLVDGTRVCHQLVTDLVAHGFKLVWPADPDTGAPLPNDITNPDHYFWVVEASTTVDPLADDVPWRISFEIRSGSAGDNDITIHVATPLQIQVVDGTLEITQTYPTTGDDTVEKAFSGKLGRTDQITTPTKYSFYTRGTDSTGLPPDLPGWTTQLSSSIRRYIYGIDPNDQGWPTGTSYPFSYRLSISDHGVAFCLWFEGTEPWGEMFSWFVVQRPVHPKTGVVLLNGKCPLFCMYGIQGGSPPDQTKEFNISNEPATLSENKYINWFVVSERDVFTQSTQRTAVKHSRYGTALINPCQQVSFTENNEFIVNFPNNLNTDRYAYVHELDMIGYTSAKVISAWTMAEIHMYGETESDGTTPFKRKYQAMQANRPLNEGMRLMMLVSGGGVDYAWPPIETSIGTIPPSP